MRPDSLGLIGLGAIGGSLAWRARAARVPQVIGWSPLPAERARAVALGAVDDAPARPEEVAARADLLVLAAPPRANEELLGRLAARTRPEALITDTGSVKAPIIARAAAHGLAARFAGSHPFAGTERQGFDAASRELLHGVLVYVCPAGDEDTPAREVAHFWESVCEAHTVLIDPRRHDAQLAWTSHLPQAVASALAVTLASRLPSGASLGPGARDATRLAVSSTKLWTEVLLANAEFLLEALDATAEHLGELRALLARRDPDDLERWLGRGAAWRRNVGT